MLLYDFIHPVVIYVFMHVLTWTTIVLLFKKREFFIKHKKKILLIVAILVTWTQIARYIGIFFSEDVYWSFLGFNFRIVGFGIGHYLPFYMCRFSVVVLLYYAYTKDKRVEPFLFYWGATGLAGILYPNGPFSNIATLTETFYIDHYLLAVSPFFVVSIQGYKPKFVDTIKIALLMFALLLVFIPINNWMNTDYFYLKDQSIFAVIFGVQPSWVFALVHSLVAFGFFNLYYVLFKERDAVSTKVVTEN